MICESHLISVITMNHKYTSLNLAKLTNKSINKLTNFENIVSLFYNKSKLKSKLNNIYNNINIPIDSFYIGTYYLSKYYNSSNNSNNYLLEDINNYVIASIILANKQLLDCFDVKIFCKLINFNFDLFCTIELDILNTINWDTYYDNQEYLKFKNLLEHYMD